MSASDLACKCSYLFCFCSEPMRSMGNAFVVCGVIYCIDAYNSKSTTINFAYDTKTGTKWDPSIQFTNLYQYNSMVDYNPREKVLYIRLGQKASSYLLTQLLLSNIRFVEGTNPKARTKCLSW